MYHHTNTCPDVTGDFSVSIKQWRVDHPWSSVFPLSHENWALDQRIHYGSSLLSLLPWHSWFLFLMLRVDILHLLNKKVQYYIINPQRENTLLQCNSKWLINWIKISKYMKKQNKDNNTMISRAEEASVWRLSIVCCVKVVTCFPLHIGMYYPYGVCL